MYTVRDCVLTLCTRRDEAAPVVSRWRGRWQVPGWRWWGDKCQGGGGLWLITATSRDSTGTERAERVLLGLPPLGDKCLPPPALHPPPSALRHHCLSSSSTLLPSFFVCFYFARMRVHTVSLSHTISIWHTLITFLSSLSSFVIFLLFLCARVRVCVCIYVFWRVSRRVCVCVYVYVYVFRRVCGRVFVCMNQAGRPPIVLYKKRPRSGGCIGCFLPDPECTILGLPHFEVQVLCLNTWKFSKPWTPNTSTAIPTPPEVK